MALNVVHNTAAMAEYDLTPVLSQYLDRHLIFPLLEFLLVQEVYPKEDVMKQRLDLVQETGMVDYAVDLYKEYHNTEEVPRMFLEKRTQVFDERAKLIEATQPVIDVLSQEEVIQELRPDPRYNQEYLHTRWNVDLAAIEKLYDYGRLQFSFGAYEPAALYLANYRVLSTDMDKCMFALWGKLAAEILVSQWDAALDSLNRLRELIDDPKNPGTAVEQLQQRTWLIHWSLFVFFNHDKGRDGIIDMFLQAAYLNTIQTTCPHILRYLTTAVITNKRRRNVLKDLVRVIEQEAYRYQDPITEFLECLYIHFDFDAAQTKLRECEKVLSVDFFLVSCRDEFIENARLFIFETYCRIHQCISIAMLGEKLNMTAEEAEIWIVNLIRNARLDAKIDSKEGTVMMGTTLPSVYHHVIEATKGQAFRSNVLLENMDKKGGNHGRTPLEAGMF